MHRIENNHLFLLLYARTKGQNYYMYNYNGHKIDNNYILLLNTTLGNRNLSVIMCASLTGNPKKNTFGVNT